MYDFSGSSNSSDLFDAGLDFLRHRIVPHSEQTDQFRNRYMLDQHQGQFYGTNQQPVNVQPTNVKIIPATPASGTNTSTGQRNVVASPTSQVNINPQEVGVYGEQKYLNPEDLTVLKPGQKGRKGIIVGKDAPTGLGAWIAGVRDAFSGQTTDYDKQGGVNIQQPDGSWVYSKVDPKTGLGGKFVEAEINPEFTADKKAAKEKVISKKDEQEKYLRDTERLKQSLGLQRQHEVGMIDQLAQRSLELARARTQMNLDASLGYEKSSPRVAQAQRKLASDAFSNEQIAMAQAAAAAGQAMAHGAQRRVGRG